LDAVEEIIIARSQLLKSDALPAINQDVPNRDPCLEMEMALVFLLMG